MKAEELDALIAELRKVKNSLYLSALPREAHFVGKAVKALLAQAEVVRERDAAQEENTRLRAAISHSTGACLYCTLPKDEWAKCRNGFPGCARMDDAMGCPELGAAMQLHEVTRERDRLAEELRGWIAIYDNCEISSGSCCCGADMECHPIYDGHPPTDMGAYQAELRANSSRAALARAGGDDAQDAAQ